MSIKLELEKVGEIRAMLGDGDPELLHDVLEGQTDIFEIMDWLLGRMADEESMQDAINSRIMSLQDRHTACGGRVKRLRDAIHVCMVAANEKTLRRPEATVTLGNRKPSIQSIDETLLPEQFFKTTRSVSKSAINEAMKNGEVVPGVTMDNGGVSLTVRRK